MDLWVVIVCRWMLRVGVSGLGVIVVRLFCRKMWLILVGSSLVRVVVFVVFF